MKRKLALFLTLCLAVTLLPPVYAAEPAWDENLWYAFFSQPEWREEYYLSGELPYDFGKAETNENIVYVLRKDGDLDEGLTATGCISRSPFEEQPFAIETVRTGQALKLSLDHPNVKAALNQENRLTVFVNGAEGLPVLVRAAAGREIDLGRYNGVYRGAFLLDFGDGLLHPVDGYTLSGSDSKPGDTGDYTCSLNWDICKIEAQGEGPGYNIVYRKAPDNVSGKLKSVAYTVTGAEKVEVSIAIGADEKSVTIVTPQGRALTVQGTVRYTVSITENGTTETREGCTPFQVTRGLYRDTELARPANDTVAALNAELQRLAGSGIVTDFHNGLKIQLHPDAHYTGTVLIPASLANMHIFTEGNDSGKRAKITGGISYVVGNRGSAFDPAPGIQSIYTSPALAVSGIDFAAGDDKAVPALNGYAIPENCSFEGYDVAVTGFVDAGRNNLYLNNKLAVDMRWNEAEEATGYTGTMSQNTFLRNVTAIRAHRGGTTAWYFRVRDCNFIDNGKDLEFRSDGTYYMQGNYFAALPENIVVTKNYADALNRGESDAMPTARLARVTGGTKVYTDCVWEKPVANVNAYSNKLILAGAGDVTTRLAQDAAADLKLDASAFEGKTVQLGIADQNDALVGEWRFAAARLQSAALRPAAAQPAAFDPSLTVDRETPGAIAVTVNDSEVLRRQPTLSIPCDFSAAQVTYNGNVLPSALADGKLSFTVTDGGTYTVTAQGVSRNELGNGAFSWTCDRGTRQLTVTGSLPAGEKLLVASYNEAGRMLSVENAVFSVPMQLSASAAQVKIFYLDVNFVPKCRNAAFELLP